MSEEQKPADRPVTSLAERVRAAVIKGPEHNGGLVPLPEDLQAEIDMSLAARCFGASKANRRGQPNQYL